MSSSKKTVIITGATSFVGMHLCDAFNKNGWQVIAGHTQNLADYTQIQTNRIYKISNIVKFEKFDIRNQAAIAHIVDKYSPSLWIQQAGYATEYASANYDFARGLDINAGSITSLFKALENNGCGVIITGTEAEYGPSNMAHSENDIPKPNSLYGIAKLTQTITARQQSDHYNIPTRVARLFLPVGSYDHPAKTFSLVAEALKNNKPIDLSPCTQKRDFIGINDVCHAYLKMAENLERGGFDIFNVCSGEATELCKFFEIMADMIKANRDLLRFNKIPLRKGEPTLVLGNNSKAKKMLGWSPNNLNQTLFKALKEQKRTI